MDEQQNKQRMHSVNEPARGTELVSGQMLKKFRRELAITRLMCIVTSILIVCLLAGVSMCCDRCNLYWNRPQQ